MEIHIILFLAQVIQNSLTVIVYKYERIIYLGFNYHVFIDYEDLRYVLILEKID
ncbi:MAG TPA: hypothetical protein VHO03_04590 [Ignavibacteriales bacterium]|nr:hypothetical protein [Ignavibacteriales bacterium]